VYTPFIYFPIGEDDVQISNYYLKIVSHTD